MVSEQQPADQGRCVRCPERDGGVGLYITFELEAGVEMARDSTQRMETHKSRTKILDISSLSTAWSMRCSLTNIYILFARQINPTHKNCK